VGFVPTILVIRRYPGPNSTGQAPLRLDQRAVRANRGSFVVIAGIDETQAAGGRFRAASR
jgi:hypothetical protein